MLAVVNENMMEVALLAQKAGVPRHAFLQFLNDSVVGSTFTRYKTPALVNLDFTTTFPPTGQRKDMDLGLSIARQLDVPMPVTAATRECPAHIGVNRLSLMPTSGRAHSAAIFETMALPAGVTLASENVSVRRLEPGKCRAASRRTQDRNGAAERTERTA
jgi:3-hydroxyisobutyrate dehydrogenase